MHAFHNLQNRIAPVLERAVAPVAQKEQECIVYGAVDHKAMVAVPQSAVIHQPVALRVAGEPPAEAVIGASVHVAVLRCPGHGQQGV